MARIYTRSTRSWLWTYCKESISGDVEDLSFETAIARVSLTALKSKALSPIADTDESHHPMPKELLVDKKLHRLLQASSIFFGEKSAQEVLEATSQIKDSSARLFIQRKWIAQHPHRVDTLDVVEIALRSAISVTEFVPNATFYREVGTSLPYVSDSSRRNGLIAVIDGQHSIIVGKGPRVDVVRLQLTLARCNYNDNDLERTSLRLEEIYLETVEPIEELETRIACLGWFVGELHDFDGDCRLSEWTQIKDLVEDEFTKTLEEVLSHGADQYFIVEEALRALSIFKPREALDVSKQLNTLERRNAAYLHIVATMCRTKLTVPDLEVVFESLDMMVDGDEKDDALEEAAGTVAKKIETGCVSNEVIRALVERLEDCCSSVTKVEALGKIVSALAKRADKSALCEEMQGKLITEFEGIDSARARYRVGCDLITNIRASCPHFAQTVFRYISNVKDRALVSDNVEHGHFYILDLVAKSGCALAQARLLTQSDLDRIFAIFSRMHDGYRKASLLSTLAFYLWREDQTWCFSDLVNEQTLAYTKKSQF